MHFFQRSMKKINVERSSQPDGTIIIFQFFVWRSWLFLLGIQNNFINYVGTWYPPNMTRLNFLSYTPNGVCLHCHGGVIVEMCPVSTHISSSHPFCSSVPVVGVSVSSLMDSSENCLTWLFVVFRTTKLKFFNYKCIMSNYWRISADKFV